MWETKKTSHCRRWWSTGGEEEEKEEEGEGERSDSLSSGVSCFSRREKRDTIR